MKKGGVKEIVIEKDKTKVFSHEFNAQMKAIDAIDCFEFVEDIDTESCAYKYLNSLNLFRY
jgi:hypothetical protein